MGPVPPTEPVRRADGFEEGVRRIVATPGVMITGPWPVEEGTEALWELGPEENPCSGPATYRHISDVEGAQTRLEAEIMTMDKI